MANHCSGKTLMTTLSVSRLVVLTGIGDTTVKVALKYLVENNYIKKIYVSQDGTKYRMLKIKRKEECKINLNKQTEEKQSGLSQKGTLELLTPKKESTIQPIKIAWD